MRIAQERADRPADHVDRPLEAARDPQLTPAGWLRWGWRQLTSMRTALILLLLLALAAIPGSLIPQQSADPNGVIQFRRNYPEWRTAADVLQLHDVFGSVWFSAIYLLLFVSLVGCVIPRIRQPSQQWMMTSKNCHLEVAVALFELQTLSQKNLF